MTAVAAVLACAATPALAAAAPPKIQVAAKGEASPAGTAVTISGTVRGGAVGQTVRLRVRAQGQAWTNVRSVRLRKGLRYSFKTVSPLGATRFEVVAAPRGKTAGAKSRTVAVVGALGASRRPLIGGEAVELRGQLPTKRQRAVRLQVRKGSRWTDAASGRTTRTGALRFTVKPASSAQYRVLAPAVARPVRLAAFTSPALTLQIAGQSGSLGLPSESCTSQQHTVGTAFAPARAGRAGTLLIAPAGSTAFTPLGTLQQDAAGRATLAITAPDTPGSYVVVLQAAASGGAPAAIVAQAAMTVAPCGGAAPVRTLPIVRAGSTHTCLIDVPGDTWCWGGGTQDTNPPTNHGQVGDGTRERRTRPVRVAGGHRFVEISLGARHTCALTADGVAYCWGENNRGELGIGQATERALVPTPVAGGLRFHQISAGNEYTCGIATTGTYCWGSNISARLGIGQPYAEVVSRDAPVRVVGTHSFTHIDAHNTETCGTVAGGTLYCWGVGAAAPRLRPEGSHAFEFFSVGTYATCGSKAGGALFCWGTNHGTQADGSLGIGGQLRNANGNAVSATLTPQAVAGGHGPYRSVSSGNHSCAIAVAGKTYCWGYNMFGVIGNGTDGNILWAPTEISGGHSFDHISVGYGHTCGVTTGGGAFCWGQNGQGQLGVGTAGLQNSLNAPAPVAAPG